MRIKVLTLFPDMFSSVMGASILGRAAAGGLLSVETVDIRDFSKDKHRRADDYPYGGGAGLVMTAQPIIDAMAFAREDLGAEARRIYLSPKGRVFKQDLAKSLARLSSMILLCGHYEGIDQRAIDLCVDDEISIGDYVLTGGELPAMVLIDSVARLIPGVLGCSESQEDETFENGLLEYPQYTHPADIAGMEVPAVLRGGNHALISRWRREKALELTSARRPELLRTVRLDKHDRIFLSKLTSKPD